jgi:SAM-dependent methyltransferase
LNERFQNSGTMKGHYFHQDLLIARKIYENKPIKHIDIGSRIDGFVAHIAVFREIEVFDIRNQENNVKNIIFKKADLMDPPYEIENYCDSISALHSIEHFGLGRYGDFIDYFGYKKGLDNIYKILKKGGKFYFSVPIGQQRVEFNAHRVFSMEYLMEEFKDKYHIDTFSYVNDRGDLFENCVLDDNEIKNNYGCIFGCGIFELTKL